MTFRPPSRLKAPGYGRVSARIQSCTARAGRSHAVMPIAGVRFGNDAVPASPWGRRGAVPAQSACRWVRNMSAPTAPTFA